MLPVALLAMSAFSGGGGAKSLEMNYAPALYRLPEADQWREGDRPPTGA